MTREEVIEFLCETCKSYKKDVKTIKDMIEEGRKNGYDILKCGVDKYRIKESCAIEDFRKPLKIIREIPPLAKTECYNGVPVGLFSKMAYVCGNFDYRLWCYLANKEDGDYIHFQDFEVKPEVLAICFDELVWLGHLKEKEDCLEFYIYPKKDIDYGIRGPQHEKRRVTPLIYS
jgi:hypothetical protein